MEMSTDSIDKTLNTLLKTKYPELSFETQMYKDRDSYTYEWYTRTNIWISAPIGFYKTKPSDDMYYDNVENEVKDVLKMFGIFRKIFINWMEGDSIYYKDWE